MKQIRIAAAVFSVMLLAGCAENAVNTETEDNNSVSDSTAVTESISDNIITSEITSSVTYTETVTLPEVSETVPETPEEKRESFEDAVRRYYDDLNNGEYKNVLCSMYPEEIIEMMISSGQIDPDDLADETGMENHGPVKVTGVKDEGKLDEETINSLLASFDSMYTMLELANEYGDNINDLTEDEQDEIYQRISEIDFENQDHRYSISEGYDITVKFIEDGEEKEESLYAFYVEDEGWKLQVSFRKIIMQAVQTRVRTDAKNIFTQYMMALCELEINERDVSGRFIISSDPEKNINVPSEVDTAELAENISDDSVISWDSVEEYFIIAENGVCRFAAVSEKSGGRTYTQYFPTGVLDLSDEDDYTLDELYSAAVEFIS